MEKVHLIKQFANRLRDAMIASGFSSQRSTSGVCIHKLAEITGYSVQICRKYLRGEAIPEPTKLVEIAMNLNVSPGWLLFGEHQNAPNREGNTLTISTDLLRYVFEKAACLYNNNHQEQKISDFLMELVHDITVIHAGDEQSKKIVDLALSSATHFK